MLYAFDFGYPSFDINTHKHARTHTHRRRDGDYLFNLHLVVQACVWQSSCLVAFTMLLDVAQGLGSLDLVS